VGLHLVVVDRGGHHHRGDFVGELGMVGEGERAERGAARGTDAGAAGTCDAADASESAADAASLRRSSRGNPQHGIRNPKQIRKGTDDLPHERRARSARLRFEFSLLLFRFCFGFRASDFELNSSFGFRA